MKIKTISSSRTYLFHQKNVTKSVTIGNFPIRKSKQEENKMSNHMKSKNVPISITQFKKQTNQPIPSFGNPNSISTLGNSNNLRQKSYILNKRSHKISQLMQTAKSFDQKEALSITCRSQSKKKKGRFFLNLSAKNQSSHLTSKDKQIKSAIRNADQSSRENQFPLTLSLNRNQSQHSIKRVQSKETLKKQDLKYEIIRSTMKKLKNLSELKLLKQKSSRRLKTNTQQWDCIEGIIERINFPNHEPCGVDLQERNSSVGQLIMLNDNEQNSVSYQQQSPKGEISPDDIDKIQQQQAQTDLSDDNEQKQTNDHLEAQFKKVRENFIEQNKKQFNKVYSLLLIYERILNKVDFMIPKIEDLCSKYQIDSEKSICHFLKQLYLSRKFVEAILSISTLEYNMHEKESHDFSGKLQQMKQDNQILYEILNGICQKHNESQRKKKSKSSGIINMALNTKESIESLIELISSEKIEFISSNVKVLKKMLKNISKDEKTIEKEFQVFLNYGTCFSNLVKVDEVIVKVIKNGTICTNNYNNYNCINSSSQQSIQRQIHEQHYIYNQCNLMKTTYLQMNQSQFERHFSDKKGHQEIQDYYHLLIKQVRTIDINSKEINTT